MSALQPHKGVLNKEWDRCFMFFYSVLLRCCHHHSTLFSLRRKLTHGKLPIWVVSSEKLTPQNEWWVAGMMLVPPVKLMTSIPGLFGLVALLFSRLYWQSTESISPACLVGQIQINSVADWNAFWNYRLMDQLRYFDATLCNETDLGENSFMKCFHNVDPKLGATSLASPQFWSCLQLHANQLSNHSSARLSLRFCFLSKRILIFCRKDFLLHIQN